MVMKYNVKVKHYTSDDKGVVSKKQSVFLVDAETFGDAEEKTYKFGELNRVYSDGMEVVAIAPTKIMDVFRKESENSQFFFAKCRYYEESPNGKKMPRSHQFLVEAEDMKSAESFLTESLKTYMEDYTACELKVSQVCEIVDKEALLTPIKEVKKVDTNGDSDVDSIETPTVF